MFLCFSFVVEVGFVRVVAAGFVAGEIMADGGETDKNIEIWKIKKLIKALESARGNGTSMISLIMPPRYVLSVCCGVAVYMNLGCFYMGERDLLVGFSTVSF